MSCLNPQKILSPETRLLRKCRKENRSFEYYVSQSKQRRNILLDPEPIIDNPFDYYAPNINGFNRWVYVPCGKCELCQKSRIDSYFVRCYFEYMHNDLACNGSTWFVTLTYADDVLPRVSPCYYDDKTGEILETSDKDKIPCFSKYHIQTWLKRLRKYSGLDFRYFVVTEFGGEFGRPHYHGILFIRNFAPSEDNRLRLFHLIAETWTKVKDRNFKYRAMAELGIFDLQRVDVKLIHDSKQISYCCKYVGKQIGSVKFDKLLIPKDNRLFHLQSIGLGENIFDYCNKDCWDKGFIQVEGYSYAIPMYYKLRLMREYYCEHENGSIIYRPSNFKYQYLEYTCSNMIREHKTLSLLNDDYPRCPDWCYDPVQLSLFLSSFSRYQYSREIDVSCDDLPIHLLRSWSSYLDEVRKYNKAHFFALAERWKNQRIQHYNKKIGLE